MSGRHDSKEIMRVTLLHNPEAGRGEHDADELLRLLEQAGHKARYQSTKAKNYRKALKRKTDVVLVAGGDGTVGKIARTLVGRHVPLSVLPLGTANNLARTLGFADFTVEEIIAGLVNGKLQNFDVGHATGPWKERYFFEGAGGGLLPDYLGELAKRVKEITEARPVSKDRELKRHVAMLRHLVASYKARDWQLQLDGEDLSGRYLLVEAMNIRAVGPVLKLAPHAKTNDGYLDFVAVHKSDRDALCDYLEARLPARRSRLSFPVAAFSSSANFTGRRAAAFRRQTLADEKGQGASRKRDRNYGRAGGPDDPLAEKGQKASRAQRALVNLLRGNVKSIA